ncbi:5'-3' exonuclease H3TH domain-containing protein [Streptomyces sp. NBC_01190]|uniref:5'-3' exonuclease n=1 Tax=Streptomyces sp. NBC_01190 TaxID=2903767 RepID=UPI003862E725|nr:5'-3' exonuclease [Streptomyces sp. NBC_01190]
MTDDKPAKLLLLDTASLYFRAYFGVPESVKAPDGTPVNAVRGLLDFIARLVADHSPTALVACMDADWRPQWRVELIPSYKSHRVADDSASGDGEEGAAEQVPDTLAPQVPVIEAVLDAIGITRIGVPGYEADDVIGTLAAAAKVPVAIVTGDRDLFQLVDDARGVRVLFPRKGVGDCDLIDEEAILTRYGVRAGQYADFAALRGDPSDGLPGVKGIGEKSAAELVTRYEDLAGVRAAAADPLSRLTPARRRNITEAAAYLDVAPKVVRVADDVPLPDVGTALPGRPAEPAALAELAERWGLGGSLARLLEVLAKAAG